VKKHTGIKVWYVLCGTSGKKVEWGWLVGKGPGNGKVEILSVNGCLGYNDADSTFFTKQGAIQNWRYHSKAETLEHVAVLEQTAEELQAKAERLRKTIRLTKPWQDL
jgi:hypothetical protein